MAGKRGHRGFGHVRRLPSKRYQASYTGPDGARHSAPSTYDNKALAEAWLSVEHSLIAAESWIAPSARHSGRLLTFADYAER